MEHAFVLTTMLSWDEGKTSCGDESSSSEDGRFAKLVLEEVIRSPREIIRN